jgi:hypothetical protein
MTITANPTSTTVAWTTKNKVGLGLGIFYAVTNIPSVLFPAPSGDDGPPLAIMIICTVLGIIATVAGVMAWRTGSRAAARLTAASLIVITLTGLPVFFVDVPAALRVITAVSVVLQIAIVVLMFSPPRRTA